MEAVNAADLSITTIAENVGTLVLCADFGLVDYINRAPHTNPEINLQEEERTAESMIASDSFIRSNMRPLLEGALLFLAGTVSLIWSHRYVEGWIFSGLAIWGGISWLMLVAVKKISNQT